MEALKTLRISTLKARTRFWLLQLLLVSPKGDSWTLTLRVANAAASHILFYMTEFAKDGAGERWPSSISLSQMM